MDVGVVFVDVEEGVGVALVRHRPSRANVAHTRQSRPDSGLGSKANVLQIVISIDNINIYLFILIYTYIYIYKVLPLGSAADRLDRERERERHTHIHTQRERGTGWMLVSYSLTSRKG